MKEFSILISILILGIAAGWMGTWYVTGNNPLPQITGFLSGKKETISNEGAWKKKGIYSLRASERALRILQEQNRILRSQGKLEPAYGLVYFDVSPKDAELFVDNRYIDKRVILMSMKPGTKQLVFSKQGYKSFAKELNVVSGGRHRLEIKLEK